MLENREVKKFTAPLQLGLILILTAVIYFNSLCAGFIWDDVYLIKRNNRIMSPSGILQTFK